MAETSTTDTRPLTDDEGVGSSPRSATSSQPQERSQPGDSNTFQSTRGETRLFGVPGHSKGLDEDDENGIVMQFERSELQVPEAAHLQLSIASLSTLETRRGLEGGWGSTHAGSDHWKL